MFQIARQYIGNLYILFLVNETKVLKFSVIIFHTAFLLKSVDLTV